jgi:hypothetical protein
VEHVTRTLEVNSSYNKFCMDVVEEKFRLGVLTVDERVILKFNVKK